jgi:hypothetical protein
MGLSLKEIPPQDACRVISYPAAGRLALHTGEIVPQPVGTGFATRFAVYTASTKPGATTPPGFWHTEVLAWQARMARVVTPEWLRAAGAAQVEDIGNMATKKNWNAKEEVTYLAGIQKYWIGYLLSLFGKTLLILVVGLCTAVSIAIWLPWVLSRLGA